MNSTWQQSWGQAWEYWRVRWRGWIAVFAATTIWIWLIMLAVPSVVPFVFMQFQPINDTIVVRTYHRQLTALITHLPTLLIVSGVVTVIGLAVVSRLFPVKRGAFTTVWASGVLLVLSYAGTAAMRVPMSGPNHPVGAVAIRVLAIVVIFVLAVPWALWHPALSLQGKGKFWPHLRGQWKETILLGWTWLVVLVMIQMVAASFAWTTTLNAIGSLVIALLTTGTGMLFQTVAYGYVKPDTESSLSMRRTS